jgi:hypothetical protein
MTRYHVKLRQYTKCICVDCKVDTGAGGNGEFYMVKNAVWQAAGMDPTDCPENYRRFYLCIGCLEERLGRRLTPEDFLDCPLNHRPSQSARLNDRLGF